MGLESNGLIATGEIQPSHIEAHPRTDAGSRSGGLAGLEFKSNTVSKGVTVGLPDLHQNMLLRVGSLRVLYRSIDLAEDTQVVQLGLGIQQAFLAQWVAAFDLQFPVDHVVASVVQA